MKISLSFPPLESTKGIPLLTQNRQFQWFNSPTYIYPMLPAYAASLLKSKGFDVFWDDGIAEELNYQTWLKRIIQEKPDLIAIETKTPVIKLHWKIIDQLKEKLPQSKIVLMGDHITALPEESMKNCKTDFAIQGGDFDFILLSLAKCLEGENIYHEGGNIYSRLLQTSGIWYRENGIIKNTGKYELKKHSLDELPLIDRELTRWKLYAYKNGNFKHTPGSYMMSGRDCWWGKCTFCVDEESQIFTINNGSKAIKKIKKGDRVLTHLGNYKKVNKFLQRHYNGRMMNIKVNCLRSFKITPNHKVLCLPLDKVKRCSSPGNWSYLCRERKYSKRLNCVGCRDKYYLNYKAEYIEAGKIKKGDFLVVPINKEIDKTKYLDLKKILDLDPAILKTWKKINKKQISSILRLYKDGKSERKISSILNLDRETIHRYLVLEKEGLIDIKINPLSRQGVKIRFEGGKKWISEKIKLDKDIFRLFGYYLAEGHVSKLKNRPNSFVLGFTFSQKEREYVEDVVKIIESNFGTSVNLTHNKKNHTFQVVLGNSLLAKVFKNLFGENCYNKFIPNFILKAGKDKQKELLKGLFRGDAHLRVRKGRGEYILSTASDVLASQIAMMLFRCSIIPSVRMTKLGKKMTKTQNIISLSTIDIIKLLENRKFFQGNNSTIYQRGFIVNNYAFLPVLAIKKEKFKGMVYNLSVEQDHSYTVNFIAVSNCSWTSLFPGQNFRTMSPFKALAEVESLIHLGVKEIMEDSGSLPIGNWLKEFCQGMIDRGYNKKVVMSCNMRINGIKDLATWQMMKKAGFRFILFGLESANQKTLDKIQKGLRIEEIEPNLKLCKQAGLEPHITAMIGYPWETRAEAQKTIDLAKDLFKKGYVDTLQATIVIPYPGTPLYKDCKKNNLLNFTDYDRFDQREQVMKSELTTADVKSLTQGLYKSFLTPQFIFRKIFSIRNLNDIKFFWRAGKKLFGHLRDFDI